MIPSHDNSGVQKFKDFTKRALKIYHKRLVLSTFDRQGTLEAFDSHNTSSSTLLAPSTLLQRLYQHLQHVDEIHRHWVIWVNFPCTSMIDTQNTATIHRHEISQDEHQKPSQTWILAFYTFPLSFLNLSDPSLHQINLNLIMNLFVPYWPIDSFFAPTWTPTQF